MPYSASALVENCFQTRLSKQRGRALLVIRVFPSGGDALIQIEDNGQGMPEAERLALNRALAEGEGSGAVRVGLHNVNNRIRLLFRKALRVTVLRAEAGCCVQIRIPRKSNTDSH